MPTLNSFFPFLGTFGDFTFYKMKGSDKTIVRRKGGHSKQRIKNSSEFENTRKTNAEFGGRSTATGCIAQVLGTQKALVDFRMYGAINALLVPVQKMDTVNEWGKRSILISKHPRMLQGLNLNGKNPFDSIVKNSCVYTFPGTVSAKIEIPPLVPGLNFSAPMEYPMFRFTAQWGILPDLVYTEYGYQPVLPANNHVFPTAAQTAWYPCIEGSPSLTLEMELEGARPAGSCSLMLSVGICFGAVGNGNNVFQQRSAGAAKILAVIGEDRS